MRASPSSSDVALSLVAVWSSPTAETVALHGPIALSRVTQLARE